jgi:aspartyl-tRNA(Asn)/glutamyl-tRNA(Gln) amidotransferase subunit C
MEAKKITIEDVKKIAELAKLDVSGSEEVFSERFTDTLKKMEILNELNTSNVEETFQVTGLTNIFQKGDSNKATLTQEEALSSAKEVIQDKIATKAALER